MSKLVAVKLLIFSVSPSQYFVIYSEKNAPFLGKFSSRVWSAPGPLFCLSLIAKSCAGGKISLKPAFIFVCSCFYFYTLQAAISRSRISFWFSFMIFLFIRRMPADINTCPTNTPREFHVESMWCVFRVTHSKGPPSNRTIWEQYAIFHLTKYRVSTIYRMLLFLLSFRVFKEFLKNWDLI